MPTDTPARRVHDLLAGYQANLNPNDPGRQVFQTWNMVFGYARDDYQAYMIKSANMLAQVMRVRSMIEALPDESPSIILEHFGQIESVMGNLLNGSAPHYQFTQGLDAAGWQSLRFADAVLKRRAPDVALKSEAANQLESQVKALIDAVLATNDLDAKNRAWLLDRLREVEEAFHDLNIGGLEDVQESVDKLAGAVFRRGARIRDSAVFQGLAHFLIAADFAINMAANVLSLTAGDDSPPPPQETTIITQYFVQQGVTDLPALPGSGRPNDETNGDSGDPGR